MRFTFFLPVFLVLCSHADGLDNGMALTPPMGYNSWYDVGGNLNESYLMAVADAMVSTGLAKAGYTYLNLDDGIVASKDVPPPPNSSSSHAAASSSSSGHAASSNHANSSSSSNHAASSSSSHATGEQHQQHQTTPLLIPPAGGRLPNGSLYADPALFTDGSLGKLSHHIHSVGLLFGGYTARGRLTCLGKAGSLYKEQEDARRFAVDWAVDYLKEDSCHGTPPDPKGSPGGTAAIQQYRNMSLALNATGKRVVLDACWFSCYPASTCPGTLPQLMPERVQVANSWRVAMDDVSWGRSLQNINIGIKLAAYAGPGHWNNLGIMAFGHQNTKQNRAQMCMYAMLSSPLLLSGPVLRMGAEDKQTYTNAAVIAVNQNQLGKQAIPLVGTQLCGGADASPPPPRCQNTMVLGKWLGISSGGARTGTRSNSSMRTIRGDGDCTASSVTSFALLAINVGSKAVDVVCNTSCLSTLLGAGNVTDGTGNVIDGIKPEDTFTTVDVWTGKKGTFTGAEGWTALQVSGGPGVAMVIVNKTSVHCA